MVTDASAGTFDGLRAGVNYTEVQSPGSGGTNYCGAWHSSPDDVWVIGIPAGVLDPGTEDAISRLSIEAVGSVGCSVPSTCNNGLTFDEVRLEINGTAVVTLTGADTYTPSCSREYYVSGGTCTSTISYNITLSGLQSASIADEMEACGIYCNATLHFENGQREGSGSVAQVPFGTEQRWSIEVFSTNADTASFTMRLSVWGLTAATLALAIGATPAWNPYASGWAPSRCPTLGGCLLEPPRRRSALFNERGRCPAGPYDSRPIQPSRDMV